MYRIGIDLGGTKLLIGEIDAHGNILRYKKYASGYFNQRDAVAIIKESLDCGGGCENCSSCWLGGGSPWEIYQDYIDGKREIKEINAEYMERYRQGRKII